MQALIAALGDYYTWELARKVYGADRSVPFYAVSHPFSSLDDLFAQPRIILMAQLSTSLRSYATQRQLTRPPALPPAL